MIGLDTNVLVRYVTQDDPVQSAKATAWIERRLTPDNPGFISIVAMAETVWVLERTYGLSDHEIAALIERLLQADVLVVENEQQVFAAMRASANEPRLSLTVTIAANTCCSFSTTRTSACSKRSMNAAISWSERP